MFFDKLLMFADAEDIAASPFTSPELDFSVMNVGKGEPINISVSCAGDAVGASITVDLQTSDAAGGAKKSNSIVTGTADQLNAGMKFTVPVPADRYAVLVVTGQTAGTMSAGITPDVQTNQ